MTASGVCHDPAVAPESLGSLADHGLIGADTGVGNPLSVADWAAAWQFKQIGGSEGCLRLMAQVIWSGLPQLLHRVSWAFLPQAMHPSFRHGRMRTFSFMSRSQPRPARSAGRILLPRQSARPSANLRSVVVGPKVMEQVRIRRLPAISGSASRRRSIVLCAAVTKGLTAKMPRILGQAARSWVSPRRWLLSVQPPLLIARAAIMAPC